MLLVIVKKSRKRSGFVIVSYILKTMHLQQLKGKQSSKLGMWNGYHDTRGVLPSKMVCKRGWATERSLPAYINFFWVSPGLRFNWTLVRCIWLWCQHTSNTTLLWFTTLSAYFSPEDRLVNWIHFIFPVPFIFTSWNLDSAFSAKEMFKLMWRW